MARKFRFLVRSPLHLLASIAPGSTLETLEIQPRRETMLVRTKLNDGLRYKWVCPKYATDCAVARTRGCESSRLQTPRYHHKCEKEGQAQAYSSRETRTPGRRGRGSVANKTREAT